MTNYQQIFDYEDWFDFRVPSGIGLKLMQLQDWLPSASEAVDNLVRNMKMFGLSVEYCNLLNSQSNFTQK